jgi:hypothetical protein
VIKSRKQRWVGHVAVWERVACRFFGGETRGKSQIERLRRRWKDNIKTDLLEVRCGSINWIDLVQDRDRWRVVNEVMTFWVPKSAVNFFTS